QRSNIPRIQASLDIIDDAPTVYDLGHFSPISIGVSTYGSPTSLSVDFDANDDWVNTDGAALLVFTSRSKNPSINFFKGPYRLAGVIEGSSTNPPTSPATITAAFPIHDNEKVFTRVAATQAD